MGLAVTPPPAADRGSGRDVGTADPDLEACKKNMLRGVQAGAQTESNPRGLRDIEEARK